MRIARSLCVGGALLFSLLAPDAIVFAQFTLPPTCSLSANATSVPVGTTITLKWNSYNASGGNITKVGGVGIYGSAQVIPTGPSTTYVGTFTGPGGTGQCSLTVTVSNPGATSGGGGGSGGAASPAPGSTGTSGGTATESTQPPSSAPAQTQSQATGGSGTSFECPTGYTYQEITTANGQTSSCVPITSTNQSSSNYTAPTGSPVPMQIFNNSVTVPAYSPSGGTSGGSGGPLVPCGLSENPMNATGCNLCDFGTLIQNIINFLLGLTIPIAVGMFAWAGILYFTATGNEGKIEHAHHIFSSVLIGFLIAISAWLIIQTLLNALVSDQNFFTSGSWNKLDCSTLNRPRDASISSIFTGISPSPGSTVSPVTTGGNAPQVANTTGNIVTTNDQGNSVSLDPTAFAPTRSATDLSNSYQNVETNYGSDIASACSQYGSNIPNCTNVVAAIATAENSGNNTGCNSTNSCGVMQVNPSNALGGCDLSDPQCNINSAVNYLNHNAQAAVVGGSIPNLIASYNGGTGTAPYVQNGTTVIPAFAKSADCASQNLYAYQCGTNPGNLRQTQQLVANACTLVVAGCSSPPGAY